MSINFKHIDHFTISIPPASSEQAKEFYLNTLGLKPIETPEALRVRGFFWFEIAGIELHIGTEEGFHPSNRHPAFVVENLEQIRASLLAKGVRIKETVKLPGRERFFVYDPFGNRMELIEYT